MPVDTLADWAFGLDLTGARLPLRDSFQPPGSLDRCRELPGTLSVRLGYSRVRGTVYAVPPGEEPPASERVRTVDLERSIDASPDTVDTGPHSFAVLKGIDLAV